MKVYILLCTDVETNNTFVMGVYQTSAQANDRKQEEIQIDKDSREETSYFYRVKTWVVE